MDYSPISSRALAMRIGRAVPTAWSRARLASVPFTRLLRAGYHSGMTFEWQPQYSVGSAEIDALHQQVFRTAARLHAAILAGEPRSALEKLLADTISGTRAHFEAEEALMRSSQYPEQARHKAKHEALAETLAACGQAETIGVETMQSLKDALTAHIDEEDRALGRHLAAR